MKWKKSFCNQSDEANFDIKQCFHFFAPFFLRYLRRGMFAKGKVFRSSSLCTAASSQSSLDENSGNENDCEVEEILSQSHSVSRQKSKEKAYVEDILPENKKRRENLHAVITKPNDEDMGETSGSRRASRKRSAHDEEVGDGFTENGKRQETPSHELATEPANVLADWSREQVKKWVCNLFGDEVADRFFQEEIDGQALLESKRLEEDQVLEKLGISTIGKKERFERELKAIRPAVKGNSNTFGRKKAKIDSSSFRDIDRLLTIEERQQLSCKDRGIYNTKKRKITKEVDKRWPRNTVLPNYRNKADALEVDKFVDRIVEDGTLLFPECGLQKAAVLEIVQKKIREQRRLQKDMPLTQDEGPSTDSASESSSSGTPSPPLSQTQLKSRVGMYNLYFHEDMTQSTADLIVMTVLGKLSLKDVKMDHLHKLKKMFNLGLLRGRDKFTHIRAVAKSLHNEGYIKIAKDANMASLTRDDITVVKTLDLGD